ncbi:SGNH/GDSL hydrolase family protein [Gordonia sp. NPDC003422]
MSSAVVVMSAEGQQHVSSSGSEPTATDRSYGLLATPTLLVVGDSFAAGTGDPEVALYPRLVADRLGWNVRVDGVGATGFVSPGVRGSTAPPRRFIDRIEADHKNFNVDLILVDGGRNDLGRHPREVIAAMELYFDQLRQFWREAKVIIMAPSYVSPRIADNYPALAGALRQIASRIDASIIDPVALGWYRGVNLAPLFGPDGVHLNSPGNVYYADKIVEQLRALGLDKYSTDRGGS